VPHKSRVAKEVIAMKRVRSSGGRAAAGFTLIELLVVMAIIGIMIGLLVPAINSAVVLSRKWATANVIAGLSTGCTTFKDAFSVYPPSNLKGFTGRTVPKDNNASQAWGYNCLAYCLCGPNGTGWGTGYMAAQNNVGNLPLSGYSSDTKVFGPYYQPKTGGSYTNTPDEFGSPMRYIFYYRFDPSGKISGSTAPAVGSYDYTDNPYGQTPDVGFVSQDQFNLLAAYRDPTGTWHWQRQDFLLISAGADRLYGLVTSDGSAAGYSEFTGGNYTCDDVCNFSH
jgi:prepilin-type N-terminal cleavage/methylation domain-containing protein